MGVHNIIYVICMNINAEKRYLVNIGFCFCLVNVEIFLPVAFCVYIIIILSL